MSRFWTKAFLLYRFPLSAGFSNKRRRKRSERGPLCLICLLFSKRRLVEAFPRLDRSQFRPGRGEVSGERLLERAKLVERRTEKQAEDADIWGASEQCQARSKSLVVCGYRKVIKDDCFSKRPRFKVAYSFYTTTTVRISWACSCKPWWHNTPGTGDSLHEYESSSYWTQMRKLRAESLWTCCYRSNNVIFNQGTLTGLLTNQIPEYA